MFPDKNQSCWHQSAFKENVPFDVDGCFLSSAFILMFDDADQMEQNFRLFFHPDVFAHTGFPCFNVLILIF